MMAHTVTPDMLRAAEVGHPRETEARSTSPTAWHAFRLKLRHGLFAPGAIVLIIVGGAEYWLSNFSTDLSGIVEQILVL